VNDIAQFTVSIVSRGSHNRFVSSPGILELCTREGCHEEDSGRSGWWRLGSLDTAHMPANHEKHY